MFSGYIKDIEAKPGPTEWGAKMPFANLMSEFANSETGGGWVHDVSFSHDGGLVVWVAHDSSISVASPRYSSPIIDNPLINITSEVWTEKTENKSATPA